MELEGRTALVTGASKNIGRAIAVKLAEEGADVGVTAKSDRRGSDETARQIEAMGRDSVVAMGDIGRPADIDSIAAEVRAALGPVDVLVNNATIRPIKAFLDVELPDLDHVFAVNFRGIFLLTQRIVPDMLEKGAGSVVNMLGANVYLGRDGHTHSYGVKMGIEGFVRQLATELGPEGIRVNGLSPGLIEVDRERSNVRAKLASTPLNRMGTVSEVADVVSFLASDRASFITGQVIHVNGGRYPTPVTVPDEGLLEDST